MLTSQDLPDELVLKILSFSETKDLIGCGQVSKRIRRISHDGTLWATANLEKKIVKTELLEMILKKGCRTLNLSHSTIFGSLSSNIKSQLTVLKLSGYWSCQELAVLEGLLSSCCSLQHLVMENVYLTPKMADSICKNGKTLQILNLNSSSLVEISSYPNNYLREIIKCCQELKEVDLAHVDETGGLTKGDLEFLVRNIPPKIEKLNLSSSVIIDDHIKILLSRCNEIKALSLEATWMHDDSLRNIRQHLYLTLEELSLGPDDRDTISLEPYEREMVIHSRQAYPPRISFAGFLELKSMPRLEILNLYYKNDDSEEIQKLRQRLPNLMIKGGLN